MEQPKTDLEIIEDFSKHFCVVCKRKIILVFCGFPIVYVSGCCCGVDHEKEKTFYCRGLRAHFGCYVRAKIPKEQKQLKKYVVKLRWNFKDVKKIVEDYYKKKEVSADSSHN
jgi:hypothetical protein